MGTKKTGFLTVPERVRCGDGKEDLLGSQIVSHFYQFVCITKRVRFLRMKGFMYSRIIHAKIFPLFPIYLGYVQMGQLVPHVTFLFQSPDFS